LEKEAAYVNEPLLLLLGPSSLFCGRFLIVWTISIELRSSSLLGCELLTVGTNDMLDGKFGGLCMH